MKKSLFAIAAVTAFAGAAQAQSSVTVYGLIDVGYTGGNARVQTPTGVSKETVNRISNSMESGSRLGFRGNEDLGGGTSAQFVFELGINPAGDNMTNTWTPNIRQGFAGLTQKGMGNVRVGTQNSLYWEQGGNMTGQLAQTAGSMLAPSVVGANFIQSNADNGSFSAAYTVRTPNTIRLSTERMAGFTIKGAYTLSNSNRNQQTPATGGTTGYSGGDNIQTGYQAGVDYTFKKALIQASYASYNAENPYGSPVATMNATTGVITTPAGGAATAAGFGVTGGSNTKDNQMLVTASYDFGILRAYAGYTNRKVTSNINSNQYLKRQAQEIGVRSMITPKIEGWASVGNGRFTAFGTSNPTANITGYQVGSNYLMSKRTNLYAIFGANQTSSTTTGSSSLNQYSLGVRHTF
jgi:predicted porin